MGRAANAGIVSAIVLHGGLACAYFKLPTIFVLFLLHLASCFLVLSVAIALRKPEIFGKDGEGDLPLWSRVFFWPLSAITYTSLFFFRRRRRAKECGTLTEVMPGILLGGYPNDRHAKQKVEELLSQQQDCGGGSNEVGEKTTPKYLGLTVIDVTAELTGIRKYAGATSFQYLNLPCFDGERPSVKAMKIAAKIVARARESSHLIVVHCTFGVGRSTTFLLAALMWMKKSSNWEDLYSDIKTKRAVVRLNKEYKAALNAFVQEMKL
uniref:Tyrosine specific protein phosphatases domain-containing protein n=2 Tax=Palpitomonas bilix TaxID=652834 RepID=A0A7S3DFT4_9EUKA|mmetsp:Transcript_35111/g.91108  ORF Transcript_35111/g.91108 Transcript_35111/m.91108 type:complete len:266 (+) Transcript_35111:96-893(+)